jgi:hypothetical protein
VALQALKTALEKILRSAKRLLEDDLSTLTVDLSTPNQKS